MKFLDKLALKIFSIIIFVVAIIAILLITGIVTVDMLEEQLENLFVGDTAIQVTIAVSGILMLLAIKGLFFTSKQEDNGKDGIVLENTSGKLVI